LVRWQVQMGCGAASSLYAAWLGTAVVRWLGNAPQYKAERIMQYRACAFNSNIETKWP
jgi:hypothetical protein